jgi:hypothetical protein
LCISFSGRVDAQSSKVIIHQDPYYSIQEIDNKAWYQRGIWPCSWIAIDSLLRPPYAVAYKKEFELNSIQTINVHVTADERYVLYLDGQFVGNGPNRGDPDNWFYDTYSFTINPGKHTFVAFVYTMGKIAPRNQMSLYHGFLFSPQTTEDIELLGTGIVPWQAKVITGQAYGREYNFDFERIGPCVNIDGNRYPWGIETGEGVGWEYTKKLQPGAFGGSRNNFYTSHLLKHSDIPAMYRRPLSIDDVFFVAIVDSINTRFTKVLEKDNRKVDVTAWNSLFKEKKAIHVPANNKLRVLFKFDNYYCIWPKIRTSKGKNAILSLRFDESLRHEPKPVIGIKGNRNETEGKYFAGAGDCYTLDGGMNRTYSPIWWMGGRYGELVIETNNESLVIEEINFEDTGYPLEIENNFEIEDERFDYISKICQRTIQIDAHDILFDWPFEQMMFVGDTRNQLQILNALTSDARLAKHCIELLLCSKKPSGLLQSRYPTRNNQFIPIYSLLWVGMVYDYALYHGDKEFVRELMPAVRNVTDYFEKSLNSQGLLEAIDYWNYIDETEGKKWKSAIPPDSEQGISSIINLQYILTLKYTAALENWFGNYSLVRYREERAQQMSRTVKKMFWDNEKGVFSDNTDFSSYSEHGQVLALLGGYFSNELEHKMRSLSAIWTDKPVRT